MMQVQAPPPLGPVALDDRGSADKSPTKRQGTRGERRAWVAGALLDPDGRGRPECT
jgi:hypothetical protein